MANHNLPTATSAYTDVLTILDERLDDIAKGLDTATATNMSNLPLYAIRWNSNTKKWEKQATLGSWTDLADVFSISISGNANTVTNGVYTNTVQTISGAKTFSSNTTWLNGTTEMQNIMGSGSGRFYGNATHIGFKNSDGSKYIQMEIATGGITTSGDVLSSSDRRLKTNLQKIDNALEKLTKISGYTYNRVDLDNRKQVGVVAQEVQAVLPEAVDINEKDYLSVAYGNLIALVIEAVKELKAEVDNIKNS